MMPDLLSSTVCNNETSKGIGDVEECGYCGTSNDPNVICEDCFPK